MGTADRNPGARRAFIETTYLAYSLPPPPGTRDIALADLDGDGDLDAFLGTDKRGQVWINDGSGQLRKNGPSMSYSRRHALVMGDVNGDGALDLVAGRIDKLLIWFNDGTGNMYP